MRRALYAEETPEDNPDDGSSADADNMELSPDSSPSDAGAPSTPRLYDVHGCVLSAGEVYCSGSHACISAGSVCPSTGSFKVDDGECSFTYRAGEGSGGYEFTYDLAPYMRSDGEVDEFYQIVDTTSYGQYTKTDSNAGDAVPKNQADIINAVQKVTYYFNLCKAVRAKDLPYVCRTTTGYDGEKCKADALAYQYIIAPKALYDDDHHAHRRRALAAPSSSGSGNSDSSSSKRATTGTGSSDAASAHTKGLLQEAWGKKGADLDRQIRQMLSVPSLRPGAPVTWWHLGEPSAGAAATSTNDAASTSTSTSRGLGGSSPLVEIVETCTRLSSCIDESGEANDDDAAFTGTTIELGLLNPLKPASGVVLKYLGGNSCPPLADKAGGEALVVPCSKSFKININCHNEIDEIPDTVEVTESTRYEYEMTINHIMGCPVECPRSPYSGRVCGSRGVCFYAGYDDGRTADLGPSSPLTCLCQEGYYGKACEVTGYLAGISYKTGYSTVSIILAFLFVLLLVVLLILTNCERLLVILGGKEFYNSIPGGSGKMFGSMFSGSSKDSGAYEWSRTDLGDDEDEDDDKEDDTLLGSSERDRRSNSVSTSASSATMLARHDHPGNINSGGRSDDEDVEAFYRDEPEPVAKAASSSARGGSGGGGSKKSSKKGAPAPVDDVALLRQVNAGPSGAAASRAASAGRGAAGQSGGVRLASETGEGPTADDVALLRAVNSGRAAAQPGKERFVTKAPDGTPAASLAEVLRSGAATKPAGR